MNARDSATGDGSADTGNPAADLPDAYERQIEALERLIQEHERSHEARIRTLNSQSNAYLASLAEEHRLLLEARERQRRGETPDGAAPGDAQVMRA